MSTDIMNRIMDTAFGADEASDSQGSIQNKGQAAAPDNADNDEEDIVEIKDEAAETPKDSTQDNSSEETTEKPETIQEKVETKPETSQGNDLTEKAIASLEKVLGKQLTDDEAIDELAKSHLSSSGKIESYADQIKELVPFRDWYEGVSANPQLMEAINKIIANSNDGVDLFTGLVQQTIDNEIPDFFGETQQVAPEIKSLIDRQSQTLKVMEDKIARLESGQHQVLQTREVETQKENSIKLRNFSAQHDDFKQLYDSWIDNKKINPKVRPPQLLQQWGEMVDKGFDMEKTWRALNADKIESNIKNNIATQQIRKLNNSGILKVSTTKAPTRDLNSIEDTEEMIRAAVANVRGRST